jgi:iron complex transport system substrate-binding protein
MIRVVSLLPAATEIVGALGLMDNLVGVSHECDFPVEANSRPRVTHCEIHEAGLPSDEIDRWVSESLQTKGTLYTLNEELMRELQPHVILTQKLCDVCAVGYGSVARMAATLPGPPRVVNLEPATLEDVMGNIMLVADVLDAPLRGGAVVCELKRRVNHVRERAAKASTRPKTFLMEWIDPPYCSGHWGPELVEIAGGFDSLGRKHEYSIRIPWQDVLAAQPEKLIISCCGFSIERTLRDLPILQNYEGWNDLRAVQNGEVYLVNGSAYFSRPGPRLVDSLEILAGAIHPEIFPEFAPTKFHDGSVARLDTVFNVQTH